MPRLPAGQVRMAGCVAVATLVSVALHLTLFWRAPLPAQAAGPGARHAATVVRVLQASARAAAAAAPATLESVLADPGAPLDIQPSAGPQPAPAAPDAQAAPAPGYLPAEQVDQRAAPLGDWQVAGDESLAGRVFEFSARVYVSRTGGIDRIELVDGTVPAPGLDALLDALARNRMRPALLQGHEVASVSTIEFRIEVQRDGS